MLRLRCRMQHSQGRFQTSFRILIQPKNPMNLSRHDHIFFDFGDIADIFLCNPSVGFRDDVGIVPYDVAITFPSNSKRRIGYPIRLLSFVEPITPAR